MIAAVRGQMGRYRLKARVAALSMLVFCSTLMLTSCGALPGSSASKQTTGPWPVQDMKSLKQFPSDEELDPPLPIPQEDSGFRWKQAFQTPHPVGYVTSAGDNAAWAADSSGAIYAFDGTSWKTQFETGINIYGLCAADRSAVWAGGGMMTERGSTSGSIFVFDGVRWTEQFHLAHAVTALMAISHTDAWASDDMGNVYHYNGFSWEQTAAIGTRIDMLLPYGKNTILGLCRYEGIYTTFDRGGSNPVQIKGNHWSRLPQNNNTGYIQDACSYRDLPLTVGGYGLVMVYDGQWHEVFDVSSKSKRMTYDHGLRAVASSGIYIWMVGSDHLGTSQTVYFYDGKDWSRQAELTGFDLLSVSAASQRRVWVGAQLGKSSRSTGAIFVGEKGK